MSMRETVLSFEIEGAPDLRVTQFRGQESISDLFRFDIDLVSAEADVDFDSIFNRPARLVIRNREQERTFEGVVSMFEQIDADAHTASYRAALVPRLWLLTLNQQSSIYQDQTVPQILESVLRAHGFTSEDYDLRGITKSYATREYVVQYQETDFNFVSRWLEHEGIFYYFKEGKVIFTDNSAVLDFIRGEAAVIYRPPAGLESAGTDSIRTVAIRQQMMPAGVVLKDYNWRKPGLNLMARSKAVDTGRGHVMEYGNHFKDSSEAKQLAQIRAEEIRCRQRSVTGHSDCWRLAAGSKFLIADHPSGKLNREYLLTEVDHYGSQMGAVDSTGEDEPQPSGVEYSNRFVCIASGVPYRPLRKTAKPKLMGTLNGRIDGSGNGQYAEIDDQGRYKVILPFDLSGRGGGKASRYIRMAQPYAGPDYGMHFPLHKGVEVIWTCIDGDPDRPIICGAVPNPDTGSPVTAANHKTSVIRDYSNNKIILDGTDAGQHFRIHAEKDMTTRVNNDDTISVGNNRNEEVRVDESVKIGSNQSLEVGINQSIKVGTNRKKKVGGNESITISGNRNATISGNEVLTVAMTRTQSTGINEMINVGGAQEVTVGGIRLVTVGVSQIVNVGMKHTLNAGTEIKLASKKILLTADQELTLKCGAGTISINAAGVITIQGTLVKINS